MSSAHLEEPPEPAPPEERILLAAVREFASKGYFGARTQAIAEEAGVNKAMLHYYFRSKEKLYFHVIRTALTDVQRRLSEVWLSDAPLEDRLEDLVDVYLDTVSQHYGIIKIVLREVVDGGQRLRRSLTENSLDPQPMDGAVIRKILTGLGEELGGGAKEGIHTLVNLIGMCMASFTSPLLLEIMAKIDTPNQEAYMADRRASIKAVLRAYASARGV